MTYPNESREAKQEIDLSINAFPETETEYTPVSPEEIPTQMAWQLTMQQLKRWRLAASIAASIVLVQAVAIAMMLPLKTTQVKYVEFKGDKEHVFQVHPANLPKEQNEMLVRKALRQFITDRHVIDPSLVKESAERLQAMSTPKVYESGKRYYLKSAERLNGGTRDIQITHDFPLSENAHQVEFITRDRNAEGEVMKERSWIGTVRYDIRKDAISSDESLSNPLGIMVTRYSLAKKPDAEEGAKSEKSESAAKEEGVKEASNTEEEKPKRRGRQKKKEAME